MTYTLQWVAGRAKCPDSPRVDCSYNVTWDLENYHHWNLPFAKTVELKSHEEKHHFKSKSLRGTYLLGVDPTAYFSVIFVPNIFDDESITCQHCLTLNFTYFGNRNYITQGFWLNVTLNFTNTNDAQNSIQYETDLCVFIANSYGIHGLDGLLGLGLS